MRGHFLCALLVVAATSWVASFSINYLDTNVSRRLGNSTLYKFSDDFKGFCFQCSIMNREGPECPNSPMDCTGCLEGYEEDPRTDQAVTIMPLCLESDDPFECELSSDCEPGFYCMQGTFCLPCLNCHAFLREVVMDCAIKMEECGPCLPGFNEAEVRAAKVCQFPPYEARCRGSYPLSVVGSLFLVAICLGLILLYQHYADRLRSLRRLTSH